MLSVIIPVHNTEEFLPRCVDSVLNSTYRDLEILFIENGSSDHSLSICNEYAAKYDNIRVYIADKTGLSHARNIGIDHASGEYIAFVDSDDYIGPYMYEKLINCILKHDADIAFCEYETGNDTEFNFNAPETDSDEIISADKYYYHLYVKDNMIYSLVCNKVFKINKMRELRFNENIFYAEDRSFMVQYVARCKTLIHLRDRFYYYYRGNKQSICNSADIYTRMDQLHSLQYDYAFSESLTDPPPTHLSEYIAVCMLKTADFRLKQARGGFDGKRYPELIEEIKPLGHKALRSVRKAKSISKKDKSTVLMNHYFPSLFKLIYKILR